MRPAELVKGFWAGIVGVAGVLGNVATVLGYLRVNPATATDAAGRAFFYAAPVITFALGCVSGWGFTRQWSRRKKVTDGDVARMVDELPHNLRDALESINEAGGAVELPVNHECGELVSRRLLRGTQLTRASSTCYYSLPPAVVRYFRERGE